MHAQGKGSQYSHEAAHGKRMHECMPGSLANSTRHQDASFIWQLH
jgi:hypothetical protein